MMEQIALDPQMTDSRRHLERPQEAEDLCNRVLQTTAELISVLDRETGMLRKGDPQEMNSLIARKTTLSTTLMRDISTLNANAAYISRVVPEQLDTLKDQHTQFQRSLRINQDALTAVKAISENLMRTIANAASVGKAGPDTYGRTASMARNGAARPAALSVNRSL